MKSTSKSLFFYTLQLQSLHTLRLHLVAGEGARESGGTGAVLGKLPFVNRATDCCTCFFICLVQSVLYPLQNHLYWMDGKRNALNVTADRDDPHSSQVSNEIETSARSKASISSPHLLLSLFLIINLKETNCASD